MAFGTGTHATTALCLDWLDENPPVGQSVSRLSITAVVPASLRLQHTNWVQHT